MRFDPSRLLGCQRILIVKPSSLGDIVHTLPAAEAIHRAVPHAKIDWLVNTEWTPILEGASFLDRRLQFPRREFRGIGGLLQALRWMRRELPLKGYDFAVDFQGLLRSAIFARHCGRITTGFARSREAASYFYDHILSLPNWESLHAVDRYLELARSLGAEVTDPKFSLPEGTRPAALPELTESPIVLHPFSRGRGKSMTLDETADLALHLAPYPVVLVGSALNQEGIVWPENVIDLLGKTSLTELIYLLRTSAWTVSVDSGPMHLATAISDRVLSLHTWSNPVLVGPWRRGAWVWCNGILSRVSDLNPETFSDRRDQATLYENQSILGTENVKTIARFLQAKISENRSETP